LELVSEGNFEMASSKNSKRQAPGTGVAADFQPHQVILRPRVTEKGVFQSERTNQYTFEVNPLATKSQIKQAVESLFNVQVDKVATQTRRGKSRRFRFKFGETKSWKKAIVKLKPDNKIDFF
jgi:large subunit ribosomal protein L23